LNIAVKFYRVLIVYSCIKAAIQKILSLNLMNVYRLDYLSYASIAVTLSCSDVQILNNCQQRSVENFWCKQFWFVTNCTWSCWFRIY